MMITAEEARKLNPLMGIEQAIKDAALHGVHGTRYMFSAEYFTEDDVYRYKKMLENKGYVMEYLATYYDNKLESMILGINWRE